MATQKKSFQIIQQRRRRERSATYKIYGEHKASTEGDVELNSVLVETVATAPVEVATVDRGEDVVVPWDTDQAGFVFGEIEIIGAAIKTTTDQDEETGNITLENVRSDVYIVGRVEDTT